MYNESMHIARRHYPLEDNKAWLRFKGIVLNGLAEKNHGGR